MSISPTSRAAVAHLQRQVITLQRDAGRASPQVFARLFLPAYFSSPSSSMHTELFDLLAAATRERGGRIAVAAPRGHAKTTVVTLACVLWCVCFRLESYIVLVSNTADQAADLLSHLKRELEGNPRLLAAFPEVCEPPGARPGPPRWRREEIVTRNDVKVTALGVGSKIRGRKHRHHRPGLIVLDDVENEADVRSPEQREQVREWFSKAVSNAGSAVTNVVAIGTILHYDSLLAGLVNPDRSPGWTARVYRAVIAWPERMDLWQRWESIYNHLEEVEGRSGRAAAAEFLAAHRAEMLRGARVLWPEREPFEQLMEMRLREGRAAFDCEKQNEPSNPEDSCFRESDFVYWDDQYADAESLLTALKGVRICGGCDPSLGRAGRHRDDSAIVTVAKDRKTGTLYILDADIRKRRPDALIEDLIRYDLLRGYSMLAIETNQFQEFLADEVRRRSQAKGRRLPVWNVAHSTDKLGRIQSLQPLVTSGRIRFSRRHVLLLDQLRQFPHAAHDDGPDALEMAVRAADAFELPQERPRFAAIGPDGIVREL